jgi:hypothetical protein
MTRLLEYVRSIGGIPGRIVEGVALTEGEIAKMLAAANGASFEELDVAAALDARAARGIVAARPIPTIDALAAVSYVGTSALEKIRVFAATWTAPPPPAECVLLLGAGSVAAAREYSNLLDAATRLDWPFADVSSLQALGCNDVAGSEAAREAFRYRLTTGAAVNWGYDDVPPVVLGPVVVGGSGYLALLEQSRSAIEERIAEGRWDPASGPMAETYARIDSLLAALRRDIAENPSAYREVRLDVEAAECSQRAFAVMDIRDKSVLIARRFPGC